MPSADGVKTPKSAKKKSKTGSKKASASVWLLPQRAQHALDALEEGHTQQLPHSTRLKKGTRSSCPFSESHRMGYTCSAERAFYAL